MISPWENRAEYALSSFSSSSSSPRGAADDRADLLRELSDSSHRVLALLPSTLAEVDRPRLRADQLSREYDRIAHENCTFANACLRRWLDVGDEDDDGTSGNPGDRGTIGSSGGGGRGERQRYELDEAHYKPSPPTHRYLPKYERITIRVRDPDAVEPGRGKLVLLPCLMRVLTARSDAAGGTSSGGTAVGHPLDSVVDDMISSTWDGLLRGGYHVDRTWKEYLGPTLRRFFSSWLMARKDGNMPLLL